MINLDSVAGEGNGTPLQCSCLEHTMDGGAWWAAIHGVAKSQTQLHFHISLTCIGEGNGNPLPCSCLENPRDGGAWWAAIFGVTQSQTWLKRLSSSSSSITQKGADELLTESVPLKYSSPAPAQLTPQGSSDLRGIFSLLHVYHQCSTTQADSRSCKNGICFIKWIHVLPE